MTLSEALKAHKKSTFKSDQELANDLGVSRSFVRNMVAGERLPKQRVVVDRLAIILDVSPDYVDHLCQRVPPDVIDYMEQDFHEVERIRERML